jgi:hypothetical protein
LALPGLGMWVSGGRAKSALPRTLAASRHETWGRLRAASLFVRYWFEQFRVPCGARLCTFHPRLRATLKVSTSMRTKAEHWAGAVKRLGAAMGHQWLPYVG